MSREAFEGASSSTETMTAKITRFRETKKMDQRSWLASFMGSLFSDVVIYKRKPDQFKARLVAKGFMQSLFDYGETYARTCM